MRFLLPFLFLLLLAPPLVAQEPDESDPFSDGAGETGEEKAAEKEDSPPGETAPPAPLNAQISQHILKLAEAERDKRMGFMRIVIDDIVRLCDLDDAQREQLELAAKGSSERSMKEWHEQAERYFRTRLESTDPDAAKEMLEGMGGVNIGGNRSEEEGESLDLWKDSLKGALTKEQADRYEAVLAQREADRVEAFARMSLSAIDDHVRLTPDQKTKMGEIVQASAAEHLAEVQKYWADYFERGMLMSLANAADEETLRAVLTGQQYDRLREATANFDHFWDQKRRLKRAKEKAADRRKGKKAEEPGEEPNPEADGDGAEEEMPKAAGRAVRIQGGGIRVKVQ